MTDYVNHPPHYNEHPTGIECIDIVEAFNFNVGNAIKYMWRAGLKGNALEDLKKAQWYINREINRLEYPLHAVRADRTLFDAGLDSRLAVSYDTGPNLSE